MSVNFDGGRVAKQKDGRIVAQRLKGFPDFLPTEMAARWRILTTAARRATLAGFSSVDTPTLEYYRTLVAEDDHETTKQIYRFTDHGGRDVGLRFDLTVPFSRFVAEHQAKLVFPFKRLQFGNVFRGEKPQKGRYREFWQCDLDIIGADNSAADAEIVSLFHDILSELGIGSFTISLGHRAILTAVINKVFPDTKKENIADILIVIDKIAKLEKDSIVALLMQKAQVPVVQAEKLLQILTADFAAVEDFLRADTQLARHIDRLKRTLTEIESAVDVSKNKVVIDLSIARGLDYYTGVVFETILDDVPQLGSICSGGRYDNLVSRFSATPYPGIGGSIGVDRLTSHLISVSSAPQNDTVFIAVASENVQSYTFKVASILRAKNIKAAVDVSGKNLKNQLKRAHRSGHTLVIIAGDEELQTETVTVRNMQTGTEQKGIKLKELAATITNHLNSPVNG